jgi:uncharacterized phage-like protein YoqJ
MIICGTGHRPDKLCNWREWDNHQMILVDIAKAWLSWHTPDVVITGMAIGWDQVLAEACIDVGIEYRAYVPFKGQESKWPPNAQSVYNSLLDNASEVKYVCEEGYAPWKMQKRNEAMVDDSDLVLALWNGTEGGTGNCIKYAQSKNKRITNLWPAYHAIVS